VQEFLDFDELDALEAGASGGSEDDEEERPRPVGRRLAGTGPTQPLSQRPLAVNEDEPEEAPPALPRPKQLPPPKLPSGVPSRPESDDAPPAAPALPAGPLPRAVATAPAAQPRGPSVPKARPKAKAAAPAPKAQNPFLALADPKRLEDLKRGRGKAFEAPVRPPTPPAEEEEEEDEDLPMVVPAASVKDRGFLQGGLRRELLLEPEPPVKSAPIESVLHEIDKAEALEAPHGTGLLSKLDDLFGPDSDSDSDSDTAAPASSSSAAVTAAPASASRSSGARGKRTVTVIPESEAPDKELKGVDIKDQYKNVENPRLRAPPRDTLRQSPAEMKREKAEAEKGGMHDNVDLHNEGEAEAGFEAKALGGARSEALPGLGRPVRLKRVFRDRVHESSWPARPKSPPPSPRTSKEPEDKQTEEQEAFRQKYGRPVKESIEEAPPQRADPRSWQTLVKAWKADRPKALPGPRVEARHPAVPGEQSQNAFQGIFQPPGEDEEAEEELYEEEEAAAVPSPPPVAAMPPPPPKPEPLPLLSSFFRSVVIKPAAPVDLDAPPELDTTPQVNEKPVHCACCGERLFCPSRCSGCFQVSYCSGMCQKEDWPSHKVKCKSPSAPVSAVPVASKAERVAHEEYLLSSLDRLGEVPAEVVENVGLDLHEHAIRKHISAMNF